MHVIFLLLCLTLSHAAIAAKPFPQYNIAYEDEFVWYLANRLTTELQEIQKRSDAYRGMDAVQVQDLQSQYEIIYHNFLLECDGPLPEVAKALKFLSTDSKTSKASGIKLLAIVSSADREFWPPLREWHGKILPRFLEKSVKGDYGFFPECIVQPFRDQNPKMMKMLKKAK